MKTVKALKAEYKRILARINENENRIIILSLTDEKQAAIQENNIPKYKELAAAAKSNEKEIIALSEKVYIDKVALRIIDENTKAAAVAEVLPVLKEVLNKYNGKPYGEKTKDKIYNELKDKTGFRIGIYNKDLTIYDAATAYDNKAEMHTGYETPVITNDNKIDATALDNIKNRYTYNENATKAARDLIKLYKKALAARENYEKALADYNHAAPAALYKSTTSNYLPHTILTV